MLGHRPRSPSMSRSSTMQAAILEAYNKPFRLATISSPIPGPGQVLVQIAASGANPLDAKIHAGAAGHARHPLPAILAMREAAAFPLVFITAWEGLVDRAAVRSRQTVLVQGGAGGVGSMVIQIAKSLGAEVCGTGSPSSRPTIERLGAQFVARSEPVADYVGRLTGGRGFDLIYDTVGGAVLDASFEAVRRFGHVVSCLGWGSHALAPLSFRAATYSGVFTLLPLLTGEGRAHHGEILAEATRLVETGRLAPILDPRRFALATVCDAYRAMEDRAGRGKIVVEIGGD